MSRSLRLEHYFGQSFLTEMEQTTKKTDDDELRQFFLVPERHKVLRSVLQKVLEQKEVTTEICSVEGKFFKEY